MIKIINFFLLLLFCYSTAFAESYLCVPIKSVALIKEQNGSVSITEVNVSNTRYLLREKGGVFEFKKFGDDSYIPCVSEYMCNCGAELWCGQFYQNKEGQFTFHSTTQFQNNKIGSQVTKGNCEKIE